MAAHLVVLGGAVERGKNLDFGKTGLAYLAVHEGRRGNPPNVVVAADVSADDRICELKAGKEAVHLRSLRPFGAIMVNAEQSLDQGQRALLRHGDTFAVRDVVMRVVIHAEPAPEEQSTYDGATENEVVSAIIGTKGPEETNDLGRLVGGAGDPEKVKQKLSCLQAASGVAIRAGSEKDLFGELLEILGKEYPNARGSVLMRAPGSDQFRRVARLRQESKDFRVSRTVLRHVLQSKAAVLSLDTAADPRLSGSASLQDAQMRSVLCLPLLRGSTVLGVIHLDDAATRTFGESDLALVGAIAGLSVATLDAIDKRAAALGVSPVLGGSTILSASGVRRAMLHGEADAMAVTTAIGDHLLKAMAATTPEQGLTCGGAQAAVGFLGGDGVAAGMFATVLPLGTPSPNTPLLMAAGEVGGEQPAAGFGAFACQAIIGALGREGATPDVLLRAAKEALIQAKLPALGRSIAARWSPGDGALHIAAGPGSVAVHAVAGEGLRLVQGPGQGTLEVHPANTVVLATGGALQAAGDPTALQRLVGQAGATATPVEAFAVISRELRGRCEVDGLRAGIVVMRRA